MGRFKNYIIKENIEAILRKKTVLKVTLKLYYTAPP